MIKIRTYSLLFALLIIVQIAKAQKTDGWETLNKLFQTYSGQLSFKSDMKLYYKHNPDKILEEISGQYIIDGKSRDYIMGYVETIKTLKYYIMVNNSRKTIFISHAIDLLQGKALFNLDALKTMLDSTDSKMKVYRNGNKNLIFIKMRDNNPIKSYQISYSSSKWLVNRIAIHLSNQDDSDNDKVLDIRYYDYHTNSNIEEITERKILTVKGENIIPNKPYQGYKVISQL